MRPAARHSDPVTSHKAAASLDASKLEEMVLNVIRSHGEGGCISDDVIAALPAFGYGSITPRYRSLFKKGLVFENGSRRAASGRSQRIMVAKAEKPEKPVEKVTSHISVLTANLKGRELKAALKYAEAYNCGGSLQLLYRAVVEERPPAGIGARTRRSLVVSILGAISISR